MRIPVPPRGRRPGAAIALLTAVVLLAASGRPARADDLPATIAAEGSVRGVYRREGAGAEERLVVLEVARVEIRRKVPAGARASVPAPGDVLYVHVPADVGASRSAWPDVKEAALPAPGQEIRALLAPREDGTWRAAGGTWFDLLSGGNAPRNPPQGSPPTSAPGALLGLALEPASYQGRLAMKVTAVGRGGPGPDAGLEVGDLVVAAEGAPLADEGALDRIARRGTPFTITVVDGKSGRVVPLQLRAADVAPSPAPAPTPAPPTPPARVLGVGVEAVSVGGRRALRVTSVTPGSPAAEATIEVGDVLVAADGVPLDSPEALQAALGNAGPRLTLTVRNVRDGQNVPVEIVFGAGTSRAPGPSPTPSPRLPEGGGAAEGRIEALGLGTALGLHETESAVKVVEVTPGGPGDRAGLVPGLLILKANDRATLHPAALAEAVRDARGSVRLTVFDPRSGRTSQVDVPLR